MNDCQISLLQPLWHVQLHEGVGKRAGQLPHWAPIRFRTAPFTLSTAQEGLKFEQGQMKERENEDMDYF